MRNTGIVYSSTEKTPTVLPEYADLLPPLDGEQRDALERDILRNGCYSPVIVNEDLEVIDGHHRLEICQANDVPFQMLVFSFEDALEAKLWAVDTQKNRRNMTIWALGNIALKLRADVEARAQFSHDANGGDKKSNDVKSASLNSDTPISDKVDTRQELADSVGISRDTMSRVMKIDDEAPDSVKEALDRNEISLNKGYNITKQIQALPEEDREQAAADLLEAQYHKAVEKLDSELAEKERISKLFCKAFEKAALLEATEDNVRAWVECTRMTPAEMSDTVVDSLNLVQVFRDIAEIMQTKMLPADWRCAHEDS